MNGNVDRARELMRLADAMEVDTLVAQFVPDAVMELPFAPGKMPRQYDGREAIYGFMVFARDAFSTFAMTVDAIHATDDPAVVIVEHHSDGVVAENGRPYRNRYCTVITFDEEGRVARWREYYDAGEVVRAFRPER
jgi:ketosteroid isomerase-like protein